jgi:hypothetical protein
MFSSRSLSTSVMGNKGEDYFQPSVYHLDISEMGVFPFSQILPQRTKMLGFLVSRIFVMGCMGGLAFKVLFTVALQKS